MHNVPKGLYFVSYLLLVNNRCTDGQGPVHISKYIVVLARTEIKLNGKSKYEYELHTNKYFFIFVLILLPITLKLNSIGVIYSVSFNVAHLIVSLPGSETHFKVIVVSKNFDKQPLIKVCCFKSDKMNIVTFAVHFVYVFK